MRSPSPQGVIDYRFPCYTDREMPNDADDAEGAPIYRVLLVDDETPDLEGLRDLVPWEKFRLVAAWATTSSTEAMEIIEREPVDILVSDIRMPRLSGLDLYARGKEFRPYLSAVFISGYADFAYAKRALEESAAAYILKPVDDAELSAALKQIVYKLDRVDRRPNTFSSEEPVANYEITGVRSRDRLIARDIKRVIDEELEKGISLKELAARFGVTPNHLGHVFHEATGDFFSDYLTRRRLEKAKILLKDSQLKIYEVADRLGYKTISHFNRVFKERYGLTPREYRDELPNP